MNRVSIPRIDPGEPVYRADLAMGEHSARHLRRIMRLYLTTWDLLDLAPAAELALTELIANVVRHVPGRRCQTFIFRLPTGDGVRVEVADSSPEIPLAIKRDELDDGGRGLILVNAVTDDWGVIKRWDGTGKTVWFECVDRRKATGARARFSPRPPTGPHP
ncbi:ATP-binding protein [Streptomyces cyaneofuscatus]|uniref:ATP-binding protein n=1 Tax=Streptomyces cyaneofuscatus TaxID=66883 RepID=UPI003320F063|nr:ATP-binding protein [Streptomyces sp. MT29]